MNPTTSPTLLGRLVAPADPFARQEAWAQFVRLYTPLLLAWARNQGLREDAADFVQEVLLRLATQLSSYRRTDGHTFRGWLFTLVRNLYRDYRTARRHRPLPGSEGLSGVGAGLPADTVAEMEEREYRLRLTRQAMEVIRDQFQPATWDAFRLVAVEGRPAVEAAAELGITSDAVYAARRRVFDRLREELGDFLE